MRSSTLLLLLLSQHSRRCQRKARRSSRQRAGARKTKRNDGINAGIINQRDLSAGLPLDCIVSRLPLRQRAQMMCVCKAWYLILRDCVAADLAELQKGPWLLMARFCRETGSWKLMAHGKSGPPSPLVFSIPLQQENLSVSNGSFEGVLMGCTCSEVFPDFRMGELLGAGWPQPVFQGPRLACSGGLMCGLLSADPHHLEGVVVVFDCLSGSVKLLPPPLRGDLLFSHYCLYSCPGFPYPCPCHIYMAVDDLDPTRYYIMLTRVIDFCWDYFERSERHMEVFDSKTKSWKDASFPLEWFEPGSAEGLLPSDVWDGDFFFVWEDNKDRREYTYIGAYNVARDAWSLRLVPHLLFTERCTLHKFRGRLFFAITSWVCHGFRVCEVKQTPSEEAAVVEVACVPREMKVRLEQESKSSNCMRLWDLLAGGSCFCWFRPGRVHQVPPLMFDLASNSWYFLREEEWFPEFYGALLYQPNLDARV